MSGYLSVRHALRKTLKFDYDVSSVSIHPRYERLVAGGSSDPWVRIHDYESGKQLGIKSIFKTLTDFKNWSKVIMDPFIVFRMLQMGICLPQAARYLVFK
jgi:hypothetical protein